MATRRDTNAIVRSLNRLTDSAFVGALSENDSAAVATLQITSAGTATPVCHANICLILLLLQLYSLNSSLLKHN